MIFKGQNFIIVISLKLKIISFRLAGDVRYLLNGLVVAEKENKGYEPLLNL